MTLTAEPLPYAETLVARAHAMAQQGKGVDLKQDGAELTALRARTAALGWRIDALGEAMRGGRQRGY